MRYPPFDGQYKQKAARRSRSDYPEDRNGAVRKAGLAKHATHTYTFRHSFVTHLLESGYDIKTVQELLGHKNVKTAMIYTHVLNRGGKGVKSPVDDLQRREEGVLYRKDISPSVSCQTGFNPLQRQSLHGHCGRGEIRRCRSPKVL